MPFIPHTEDDIRDMLAAIGVGDVESLFDEIPDGLRSGRLPPMLPALQEMQVTRLMHERATRDLVGPCFIGAGAYRHHVPAAVWQLATRGEFYSAYTPYQAEASQGTLQLIYEYQSMMCGLMAMDVSNASLYDGASGLGEAMLMAVRANQRVRSGRILVADSLHPVYRRVAETVVGNQGVILESLPLDAGSGVVDTAALGAIDDVVAVVIPQPNFFGRLEDVDRLVDWAHGGGALVIGVVNPLAMALLKPPGEWGEAGADIACGDGQPLGVPLSSGGPYYGFLCCRRSMVRRMPGRIVGRTVDLDGRTGYTLTLQAREQHIRRSRATSNICTNQGLVVTASTIHMALLGAEGLRRVAATCHARTRELTAALSTLPGVAPLHAGPCFHERALDLGQPAAPVLERLAARGILGGYALGQHDPALGDAILVCATECIEASDIAAYRDALAESLREAA